MEGKRKILHIIDSLGRGGAETLLVGVVNSLPQFDHVIISLKPVNDFQEELSGIKIFTLDFQWYHSIPKAVQKVKSIIHLNDIDVVHANLFWSAIVSRLATPKKIKLINSYHALLYGSDGADYPFYARLLDKFTYRSNILTICVSKGVQKNIYENLGINKNTVVLHNFIEDIFFDKFRPAHKIQDNLKLVAVGNLKKDKNYEVVIDAFGELSDTVKNKVTLDIFGKGYLLQDLTAKCQEKNITNINFKGSVTNIASLLPAYDVFINSSTSEGFGLAVAEAMAVGLPVVVSDIPVLKEISSGNGFYFNPTDSKALAKIIENLFLDNYEIAKMSVTGHEKCYAYKKDSYMKRLSDFYTN